MLVVALAALGCRSEKEKAGSSAEKAYRFSVSSDVPIAVELYRSGIEAQCSAAAEKKARYVRGDAKFAADMRAEFGEQARPTADDVRRRCIERSRGKSIAADIAFALDLDLDKLHARAAELEATPYRDASGSIHPGNGLDEALVEAIVASDKRLADRSDRTSFCFVAALKFSVFVLDAPSMLDNCLSGPRVTDATDARVLDCIVDAQRRAQAIECTSGARPGKEAAIGDLTTGERPADEDAMSLPRPRVEPSR